MVSLTVNGKPQTFDGDPEMPLLWYLRDVLQMTGTKFGCGIALCGACTVHIDGGAARSCLTPMSAVNGKKVTTIEGLDPHGKHALQEAWRAHGVPQCGYCQAGQIMSAAALLASNKKPSSQDIDNAMSGNICRCGTYPRIKAAIQDVASRKGA
ncbi:MAG TPA: (2Fe-2S)-binding protein [Burkholderiales bacterium]|nr:(2Fe-2S)-binding protein [Usitatibacter sp.]HUK05031.1 (2Fe-2S)-binding protein [Burkholderiales bacterium]